MTRAFYENLGLFVFLLMFAVLYYRNTLWPSSAASEKRLRRLPPDVRESVQASNRTGIITNEDVDKAERRCEVNARTAVVRAKQDAALMSAPEDVSVPTSGEAGHHAILSTTGVGVPCRFVATSLPDQDPR